MSDGKYQPLGDNMDDLPRTLRRAREQQQREQAAQPPAAPAAFTREAPRDRGSVVPAAPYSVPEPVNPYDMPTSNGFDDPAKAVVTRIKVPFFSLMGFFIKAVFAAIPALLILIGLFYGLGIVLQTWFPELIKMKIVISFPG